MKILCLLLLFPLCVAAYETTVESDEARYDGEFVILTGHVSVENAMGKVTAQTAVLRRDETRSTKIDFPWIELKEDVCLTLTKGGTLRCASLFLDYTQMTSFLSGSPQLSFSDTIGEVFADRAQIDYREIEGALEATKVTLLDHVKLVNSGSEIAPCSQYALADEVSYYPQEQVMLLEGKQNRVLFYDKQHDMQLSARTVRAQRDPETKKESIQGVGDVRFVFGPEEMEKIKQYFTK